VSKAALVNDSHSQGQTSIRAANDEGGKARVLLLLLFLLIEDDC